MNSNDQKAPDTMGSLLMDNMLIKEENKRLMHHLVERNRTISRLNKMLDRISWATAAISEYCETGEETDLREGF